MATTSLRQFVSVCASASFELSVNPGQEVRCILLQCQRDPLDAEVENVITCESYRADKKSCAAGDHFLVQTAGDDTDADVVRCGNIVEDLNDPGDRSDESEHRCYTGDHSKIAEVLLHT